MMTALDNQVNTLTKEAFKFFIHEDVIFLLDPAQIIIGPLEEKHIMNEENFYDFQRILRRMYFLEQEGEDIIIHENDSIAVKNMKI